MVTWHSCLFMAIFSALAQGTLPGSCCGWLRTPDARIAAALEAGKAGSATFRMVAWRVHAAGGIVYFVRTVALPRRVLAMLRPEQHGSGGTHYIRVLVHSGIEGKRLTATLAHELQHANELLSFPSTRSAATYEAAFARIGFRSGPHTLETAAAQAVETKVIQELSSIDGLHSANSPSKE